MVLGLSESQRTALPAEAQNPAKHEESLIVLMACGLLNGNSKVQLVFWELW